MILVEHKSKLVFTIEAATSGSATTSAASSSTTIVTHTEVGLHSVFLQCSKACSNMCLLIDEEGHIGSHSHLSVGESALDLCSSVFIVLHLQQRCLITNQSLHILSGQILPEFLGWVISVTKIESSEIKRTKQL